MLMSAFKYQSRGKERVRWLLIFLGGLTDPLEDLMKALSLLPRKGHTYTGLFPDITSEGLGTRGEAQGPRVKNSWDRGTLWGR